MVNGKHYSWTSIQSIFYSKTTEQYERTGAVNCCGHEIKAQGEVDFTGSVEIEWPLLFR